MAELVVDFSHGSLAQKRAFLEANADKAVVMDLSCIDPSQLYSEYAQLKGSFPGQFALGGKVELHLREEVPGVEKALREKGLTPVRTASAGLGFTVPRILAMVVNEAFFALEEGIATAADIDTAMRYGVNYPGGPFGWAKGRESIYAELLEALLVKSGDARYSAATSLRNA